MIVIKKEKLLEIIAEAAKNTPKEDYETEISAMRVYENIADTLFKNGFFIDKDRARYTIAYLDKEGKGFKDNPWLFGNFENAQAATVAKTEMERNGYQKVTVFVAYTAPEETVTWNFVNANKVD